MRFPFLLMIWKQWRKCEYEGFCSWYEKTIVKIDAKCNMKFSRKSFLLVLMEKGILLRINAFCVQTISDWSFSAYSDTMFWLKHMMIIHCHATYYCICLRWLEMKKNIPRMVVQWWFAMVELKQISLNKSKWLFTIMLHSFPQVVGQSSSLNKKEGITSSILNV